MSAIALGCIQLKGSPVKYAMAAVIVAALVATLTRPSVFYDPSTDALRNFGTGPDETIFPAWLAMMSAGYLVYVIAAACGRIEESRQIG